MQKRHDDLVVEMIFRGMNHNSPIADIDFLRDFKYGEIDIESNINELINRCPKCKDRLINGTKEQKNLKKEIGRKIF